MVLIYKKETTNELLVDKQERENRKKERQMHDVGDFVYVCIYASMCVYNAQRYVCHNILPSSFPFSKET